MLSINQLLVVTEVRSPRSLCLHYMVSEVGWLVFVCSRPLRSVSKSPDTWQKWKRRFEQYRQAFGLAKESDEKEISTLLYCMGEDAKDTLSSTDISSDDCKKFDTVIGKFDAFLRCERTCSLSTPELIDAANALTSQSSSS